MARATRQLPAMPQSAPPRAGSARSISGRTGASSGGSGAKKPRLADPLAGGEAASLSYVCSDCDRTGKDDNPTPDRHPGPRIRFASSTQCLNCRNFQNSSLKHKKRKEIVSDLKDPPKKAEYKVGLKRFEELFNAQAAGTQLRNLGEKMELPTWMNSVEVKSTEKAKLLGVLWPRSVLIRENITFNETDLAQYPDEDELCLLRDYKHGKASGCSELIERSAKQVTKTTQVASSSSAVLENELAEKWQQLTRGSTAVKATGEGELVKLRLSHEGGRSKSEDDSDGDDSWDELVPKINFGPPAANETDPELEPETKKPPRFKKKKKGLASPKRKAAKTVTQAPSEVAMILRIKELY